MSISSTTRRLVGAGATLAAVAAVLPAPAAGAAPPVTGASPGTTACHATVLPVPAGHHGTVRTVDPSGRYVLGYWRRGTSGGEGFWDNGVRTQLTPPLSGATLTDINSQGVVVGVGTAADGTRHGFVHRDGGYTVLPNVRPAEGGSPMAINERGDVVGVALYTNGPGTKARYRYLLWPAADPTSPLELATPPIPEYQNPSVDIGVDDDGTIIATVAEYLTERNMVFRWRPDGWREVAGQESAVAWSHWSFSIRNGWVAGGMRILPSWTPVLWNTRTGGVTSLPAQVFDIGQVNASGHVPAAWSDATGRFAVVVRDGAVVKLPRLGLDTAISLSDSGNEVVGTARVDTLISAVLWRGC